MRTFIVALMTVFVIGCSSKPTQLDAESMAVCEETATQVALDCYERNGGQQLVGNKSTELYDICYDLAMRATASCYIM